MENELVRCPFGHGLFLVTESGPEARCPACGALLLVVRDDHVSITPANWFAAPPQDLPIHPVPPSNRPTRIAIPA
jgi:hypothetical protein